MMAFVFRFDAALNRLIPMTRRLSAFKHGLDSDVPYPFADAGYDVGRQRDHSVDITDCYRHGQLTHEHEALILRVCIVPGKILRIVSPNLVTGTEDTPTVPRHGGEAHPCSSAISRLYPLFVASVLHGGEALLMPADPSDVGGSMYMGPTRLDFDSAAGWRPSVYCLVSPEAGNEMRFTFPNLVDGVRLPKGTDMPDDGDYVVLDLDVRVHLAHVRREGTTASPVDDHSRRALEAWVTANAAGVASDTLD